MANDFKSDPRCRALWKFDDDDLGLDSISRNHLYDEFPLQLIRDTTDFKEGVSSANFLTGDVSNYPAILDNFCYWNFPLQTTSPYQDMISIAFWVKLMPIPGPVLPPMSTANAVVFSKGTTGTLENLCTFTVYFRSTGPSTAELEFGSEANSVGSSLIFQRDGLTWYHISMRVNRNTNSYEITAYNTNWPTPEQSVSGSFGFSIPVVDSERISLGVTLESVGLGANYPVSAKLDEIVVFDRIISNQDSQDIRNGVYEFTGRVGENDLIKDNDCRALWRYELPNVATDSFGNYNLTNNNGVAADLIDQREPFSSSRFLYALNKYFSIPVGSLDPAYPLHFGDTIQKMSLTFWLKTDMTASQPYQVIYSKGQPVSSDSDRTFLIALVKHPTIPSTWLLQFVFYTAGETPQVVSADTLILNDQWYHVGFTCDNNSLQYKILIWDDTNKFISEIKGGSYTTAMTLQSATGAVTKGGELILGTIPGYHLNGNLDEMTLFNRQLKTSEILKIRQGSYGINDFSKDISCVTVWNFNKYELPLDSKNGNGLTDNSPLVQVTADDVKFIEGTASAYFPFVGDDPAAVNDSGVFFIPNLIMNSNFPFKSGNEAKSFSICFWFNWNGAYTDPDFYYYYVFKNCSSDQGSNVEASVFGTAGSPAVLRIILRSPGKLVTKFSSVGIYENKWYHAGISVTNVADGTPHLRVRIFDYENRVILSPDIDEDIDIGVLHPSDYSLLVGAAGIISVIPSLYNTISPIRGNLDEFVVFSRALTFDEIDQVRSGTYGYDTDLSVDNFYFDPPSIPDIDLTLSFLLNVDDIDISTIDIQSTDMLQQHILVTNDVNLSVVDIDTAQFFQNHQMTIFDFDIANIEIPENVMYNFKPDEPTPWYRIYTVKE